MNPTSESAKEQILADIRRAIGKSAAVSPGTAAAAASAANSNWEKLHRDYARLPALWPVAALSLFEHRLKEYDAHVFHAAVGDLPVKIGEILNDRQKRKMLIPPGVPSDWIKTEQNGLPLWTTDIGLTHTELDRFDGVLTSCTVGIAITGTLVLQHGLPGQGRRALSLIPDYHLCIVRSGDVVETVSQAIDRLDPTLPTTFISGPSATADIEMTRIKGVHGPRFLDVIIAAG